jgi:hypothetical protein
VRGDAPPIQRGSPRRFFVKWPRRYPSAGASRISRA